MTHFETFPDHPLRGNGTMTAAFLALGIRSFREACDYVHRLPYGYNSNRDDPMMLFKEAKGTCTTKHAVIATLATELDLPVTKRIGIYAMTEGLVAGAQNIIDRFKLPYVPMIHCFLAYDDTLVDLTAGNRNGKKRPIEAFLHTEAVAPAITAKEEYLRYRTALKQLLQTRGELRGIELKTLLQAREEGLALLKANIGA
jgi:hypothetical protein